MYYTEKCKYVNKEMSVMEYYDFMCLSSSKQILQLKHFNYDYSFQPTSPQYRINRQSS